MVINLLQNEPNLNSNFLSNYRLSQNFHSLERLYINCLSSSSTEMSFPVSLASAISLLILPPQIVGLSPYFKI